MKRFILLVILPLTLGLDLRAQPVPDSAELTSLLKEFLAGASRDDAAVHDRFWAEDLIYTRSAGKRIGKADIMRDLKPKPDEPATTYTAEDIRIQQYGTTAIVAFRLVGNTEKEGITQVTNFLNTGTFLKRNGKWQAVAWQATKMPRAEEDAKKEVAAAERAFQQAMRAADLKKLESMLDENFVWTRCAGEVTRQQLRDELKSGESKYPRLEASNVTINVYSDAAVVRSSSYTLTFANKDGDWKAVAMHSTGP